MAFDSSHLNLLLNQLTSPARDLVNEITAIAEQNIQDAQTIANLIETRIRKCVPRYKLFAFYALDSIVKNIGDPYRSLFSSNLDSLFTETYVVVADVTTRQHLIDLFTTWRKGQTSSGTDLFNKDLLLKIEQFIIKATRLNKDDNGQKDNGSAIPRPELKLPSNIAPEHFHREFNYLLQYIIQLNKSLSKYDDSQFAKVHLKIRNNLVTRINEADETILRDGKSDFLRKTGYYHHIVIEIRGILDQENFKQNRFILKHFTPDLTPDSKYTGLLNNPFEPIEEIDHLYFFIEDFGIRWKEDRFRESVEPEIVNTDTLQSLLGNPVTMPEPAVVPAAPGKETVLEPAKTNPEPAETSPEPVETVPASEQIPEAPSFGDNLLGFSMDFEEPEPEPRPTKKVRFNV